ncbi:GNAT family N-acetyltransferase [Pseudonocardia spinosispora]|uniref:GNAT family N-acetyltransferase n=1 Tax=Pseudonocardia spinosispora TaxID=103441 RepID=UPI00040F2B1A|nr:GNAT family N-acetyltransferase [Pseudonocardia spinosispora]
MFDLDQWPLHQLVLRTPRLELRPDDDAGLAELASVARKGVHPPEQMPFAFPWTDADPDELGRNLVQYHWSMRAALNPRDWTVQFLIRVDGQVIGCQGLTATNFALSREVSSGSWLGMDWQGQGYGTEMRAAVLMFAFDHLGARTARSGAFLDNASSRRVSEKVGYRADGTETWIRRGAVATQTRLLLDAGDLRRPDWSLSVSGLDACRSLLGA